MTNKIKAKQVKCMLWEWNIFKYYLNHISSPDLPHIPVQHSAWVEGGKAATVRRLLRRVQFERL